MDFKNGVINIQAQVIMAYIWYIKKYRDVLRNQNAVVCQVLFPTNFEIMENMDLDEARVSLNWNHIELNDTALVTFTSKI